MTHPRPRAVLFDLFHTLVNVRPEPDTGHTTWGLLGVSAEAWERALVADAPGRGVGRVRCPVEGIGALAREIDPTIPDAVIEHAARWRERRFAKALREPEPAVVDALARLRRSGRKLALVSNAGFDEIGGWSASPLAEHFEAAVFSCEVGVAKPDAGIYEHALSRIGVAPADALFVGDGGSDEHRGARRLGLRTAIVTRYLAETWPERVAPRRAHADEHHEDVPALADHLLGAGASRP